MSSGNPVLQDAPRVARCKVCHVSLFEGRCLDNHPQSEVQHDAPTKRGRPSSVQLDLHDTPVYKMTGADHRAEDSIAPTLTELVFCDDAVVLDHAGRPRSAQQLADDEGSSRRVLRFWHSDHGSLPSRSQIETSMSWSGFRTIVFTNVEEQKWSEHGMASYMVRHYNTLAVFNDVDFNDIAPQFRKDLFQFGVVRQFGGWCVDWDVHLLDANLLPTNCPVIGTEVVRTTGRAPKQLIRDGERLHLAVSRFDLGDPWCDEIVELLKKNLPKLRGVNKDHFLWMSNTRIVQEFLLQHNCPIAPSILLNPLPLFLKNSGTLGTTYFGSEIPSVDIIVQASAALNTWEGYRAFPYQELLDIIDKKRRDVQATCKFHVCLYLLYLVFIKKNKGSERARPCCLF